MERKVGKQYKFKNHKLSDVKNGNILLITRNKINSNLLSGVYQKPITISLNKLHYKKANDNTKFPKRYKI